MMLTIGERAITVNKKILDEVRQRVPRFEEDTVKYLEIKEIKDYLCTQFIDILNK